MTDRPFTILSTGSPVPEESRLSEKGIVPDGVNVEEIPFIQIDLITDDITRNQVLAFAAERLVVVFTSANAVRAVTALLHKKPAWRIYCIGHVTEKQVSSFFGEAAIIATASNAEALSTIIIHDQVKQAVFFCGDQRRQTLPDKLKENDILLQELVVYHTRCTPVRLEKDFDAILFFSPTAVTSFFSMNTVSSGTLLFALGASTGSAIRQFSDNELVLAGSPDKISLFQMAVSYGQQHPIH